MIKESAVLIEGFKSILKSTADYSLTEIVTSEQSINEKAVFPLIVFNYGSMDLSETGLKSQAEKQTDGTFVMQNLFVYDSQLDIYSEDSLDCVVIAQALVLGKSSETFQHTLNAQAKTAKIRPPGILNFTGLQQNSSIQGDNLWLHKCSLSFTWNFTGRLQTAVPCFQTTPTNTYPKIEIKVKKN